MLDILDMILNEGDGFVFAATFFLIGLVFASVFKRKKKGGEDNG